MRCKKGVTIIECLLSMLVLAIMLTAGMAFYFNAQASMAGAIEKRLAAEAASAQLESIKNGGYINLPDPAPAGNLWQGPAAVAIGGLTGQRTVYLYDIDEDGAGTDYKRVQVNIAWQEPGKSVASAVTLDTLMSP